MSCLLKYFTGTTESLTPELGTERESWQEVAWEIPGGPPWGQEWSSRVLGAGQRGQLQWTAERR